MTALDLDQLAALAAAGLSDPQIADALAVSARTVLRARRRHGIASTWSRPAPLCGTLAAYRRGCRCRPCRAANVAHWRRYARREVVATS